MASSHTPQTTADVFETKRVRVPHSMRWERHAARWHAREQYIASRHIAHSRSRRPIGPYRRTAHHSHTFVTGRGGVGRWAAGGDATSSCHGSGAAGASPILVHVLVLLVGEAELVEERVHGRHVDGGLVLHVPLEPVHVEDVGEAEVALEVLLQNVARRCPSGR